METVIRVLASAPKRDQNSAANKEGKKSEVAWRNRQAKAGGFARDKLPGNDDLGSRRYKHDGWEAVTPWDDGIRSAQDDGLSHAAADQVGLSAILCTTLCRRK